MSNQQSSNEQVGPKQERWCYGCKYLKAERFKVQGDRGTDYTCMHGDTDRAIASYAARTPEWCPVVTTVEPCANPSDLVTALAHRAVGNQEQDMQNGKLAGYCIVCQVPWPCDTAKHFLRPVSPPKTDDDAPEFTGLESGGKWFIGDREVSDEEGKAAMRARLALPPAVRPVQPPSDVHAKLREARERIAWAWSIIANVSGGDWSKQSQDWQDAAAQWEQIGDPYEGLASRDSTTVTKGTGL
jgi:hypothetical protein